MKKILGALLITIITFGFSQASQAATISVTLAAFIGNTGNAGSISDPINGLYYNQDYFNDPLNPNPYFTIGAFNFVIPAGEQIVSAVISGSWGDTKPPFTSAHNILNLDSINIANTHDHSPDPFGVGYKSWSYTFKPDELGIFSDNIAILGATQDSPYKLRLGETTLDLVTAPVPEPSSMILGIMGLVGALGLRKKRK